MADTMIIAMILRMILVLVTSCQAIPYLVQPPPMSTDIVSGGTAEFTCGIAGRSTETILWFVNIVDTKTHYDIPTSPEANKTNVDGFVYDVEYNHDGVIEYYQLTVLEVMVPLSFTCVFISLPVTSSRTLLSEWVSLTLIYSASTTSLPSSSRNREPIATIKLEHTTTSQNDSTSLTDMSSVAAIAGGVSCCIVVIIFLIGVTLYLRIQHGYCYTCEINKAPKSDTVVPSETLHSIGTANNGFTDAINEGNSISNPYVLSNGKQPAYALPKEGILTPGEMPTYALPKKKKSTPAEMPTYALPEKRQSTPAIMPTYALQHERQSSPGEIPTYALPNKRQSSPGEIPTHALSPANLSKGFSTEQPPTYAIPDKTRASVGEMPTYAMPNKRQSTVVNKTPDANPGKYLATVDELPTNDQFGDPLYAEVPVGNCETNDVDSAYAVVPIDMDKKPKKNANIEGLNYADVERTSSTEDAHFVNDKLDATLYADIQL